MSGTAGSGAELDTLYAIPPTRATHSTVAMIQALRSESARGREPPLAGAPHRWQNRAWGESSARQAVQDRPVRLAPQALQKFPEAGLPQEEQVVEGAVIVE
jgi:hypothetical protein